MHTRYLPVLLAAVIPLGSHAAGPVTYCNPLPIPDYPLGRLARDVHPGEKSGRSGLWILDRKEQYRELADPTAVWHEGKWYLYPSVDMAWVSSDRGATWEHHPLNIRDVGYAPTVMKHRGKFLLLASDSALYSSDSPLGPFSSIGHIEVQRVKNMPGFTDPMLFSDDGGRLFFYWGCTRSGGIWGAELDSASPTQGISVPAELIPFDPVAQPWEVIAGRTGDRSAGWMEGAWMLKRGGIYYLTYSASGTENRTYAMGCYTSKSPLGPFVAQKRNPILRTTDGLVTGTAHGCIVPGPDDELWAFYTVCAGVAHGFERRVGMDRARIESDGELNVGSATSHPQWLSPSSSAGNADTGWLPLNVGQDATATTAAAGRAAPLAGDSEITTWWQPAEGDPQPVLTTPFRKESRARAVRVIWRDIGLDVGRGAKPGPFRYRVELQTAKDRWTTVLDRSQSREDYLVDYREIAPSVGLSARLIVCGSPQGITPGVAEFTVFGQSVSVDK